MFTCGPAFWLNAGPDPNCALMDNPEVGAGAGSFSNEDKTWTYDHPGGTGLFDGALSFSPIVGKTYVEFEFNSANDWMSHGFGVTTVAAQGRTFFAASGTAVAEKGYMFVAKGCGLAASGYYNGGSGTSNASYAFVPGDRIGIAFDPATRNLWFSKNGTWISGDPAAGTSPTMTIASGSDFHFSISIYTCNLFGASGPYTYDFYASAATQDYAAPAGFSPHCT